jgi:transcriptional regulator with XRE-family HTH domain
MANRSIGENIRCVRRHLNVSQESLAEVVGCTRQTISNWENGRTVPSRYDVSRVAAAFNCSEQKLTEG